MSWLLDYFFKNLPYRHESSKLLFHLNAAATNMFLLVKYSKIYILTNYCAALPDKIRIVSKGKTACCDQCGRRRKFYIICGGIKKLTQFMKTRKNCSGVQVSLITDLKADI